MYFSGRYCEFMVQFFIIKVYFIVKVYTEYLGFGRSVFI